ncbi:uncharacterized protein LOC143606917 isoform X1 [Bidens hawaiensis]|uniref:uncharacterized protein LOC143606917 isoform X1 n=1 Tax=Bidens hawaiensis TaxID=980011 RepID=UPI00404911EA
MPGNGVGDRVHNFFAQENLRSQDENWSLDDNLWVGNQKQFGVSDTIPRNYNPQQSEIERGHGGQRLQDQYAFNITQANASSNGYMYGRQNFQTRPDEANFMGVNTEYDQNNVNQRGFPFHESQQEPGLEQPQKNPFRSDSSEAYGSFDLFGGQHQTNGQHPGLLQQPLQQQSGFSDTKHLQQQQQLMLRRMQELQKQQEFQKQQNAVTQASQFSRQQNALNQASYFARQNEIQKQQNTLNQASQFARQQEIQRQQNSLNQASQFARQQASGSLSLGLVNGTRTSDSSGYGWTEPSGANPNWLHRAEQQVEPSLHGVPVSSSRGPINQFPSNNSFTTGNTFGQGSNSRMKMDNIQKINASVQESPVELVQNKSATDAAPLDPEEEKILFGSDVNIWEAFGSSKNMTGGMSGLLDDNEFASGLPSMQSGSWSALMQSAVAETTSDGDVGVQETQTDLTDINLPNMNGKHHTNTGFHHSSGGSSWLHHGDIQKTGTEQRQVYENSVPGQRTPHQHVAPSMNAGFNMNENNDWKRVNTAANHNLNYWKHVDSSVKSKGSETSEITQRRLNKGPQVSESSFNSSDKEDLNSSRKENSNDSFRSSSSHLPNTVGQREHLSSDAGDSRSKQILSNQTGRKIPESSPGPGSHKFQYHPMGNLDEDVGVPYGTRQGTNIKPVSLQHSGLPKSRSQVGSDDMRFKGMVPGHLPNIFASHDRSVGLSTSVASQPSSQNQNMLELLHKVDQSRDGGIARKMNSLEQNMSSEIPEPENSDGSFGGHQRSQSSNSQGIGLQLGPPSQRLPMSMQAVKHNSLSQSQPFANSRGKSHAELSFFPTFQETSHGEFKNDRMSVSGQSDSQTMGNKMMTNLSSGLGGTDFPTSRNHLQNRPTTHNESFEVLASHPRVSQQCAFPKMLPNASLNLQSQQVFSASQPRKSQFNIVESTSLGQQNLEVQESERKENKSSLNEKQGIITSEKVDRGQMMNGPAAGNDSSTASQKDLEAFGRSLKPNNFHQQISVLNQMKAYKHTDNDPNNRVLKRLKDSDNLLRGQQVTVLPGDSETPRSTISSDKVDRSLVSLPAYPLSKDALASNQNGPTVRIENSHISPQMAPSWFDHYGTLKSGQMSSQPFKVSGSLETTAHASKEPSASGATDTSQDGYIWKPPVSSSVVVDHQLASQPLQPNIAVQSLVTVRPKKRKWSRHDIHSWLKEVSGSSKNLQGIWTASNEWCEATKRLMEKVEDDGELIEDASRPKRRIILATQLMQQLFPPPPPVLLSTEAILNYETVAFYAARLAHGDACNLVSCASHRKSNLISNKSKETEKIDDKSKESEKIDDKSKEYEKIDDYSLSEAVEDCVSKGKRVESDFTRLDKRASILDLRLEIQDLEKFSMINRFAKYHGRGQADGESSSLLDETPNAPKAFPQRYVIAVPLPKNLPERVQCLSL